MALFFHKSYKKLHSPHSKLHTFLKCSLSNTPGSIPPFTSPSARHMLKTEGAKRMRLWVADGEAGLMRGRDGDFQQIGPPGDALCAGWGRVYCAGQGRFICYDRERGEAVYDAATPPGINALTILRNRVCALSGDADSVTAFSAMTGEILCSAPAGSYPRDLCVSSRGNFLAVAGGAAGRVYLMDEELRCLRAYPVPGTVCGVCFLPRGMAALCAVETGELSARLYAIRYRGATEEIAAFPFLPSCLCGMTDGSCAAGCHGEAILISTNKKAAFRQPVSCPVRIRPSRLGPLICDCWQGTVFPMGGLPLYQGPCPQDALLLPS